MGLTNSRGKRPSRLHCSIIGTRLSSIKRREVSRTSRSSSESSESNSMKSTPLNLKTGIVSFFADDVVRRDYGTRKIRRKTPVPVSRSKLAEATGRVKLLCHAFECCLTESWQNE